MRPSFDKFKGVFSLTFITSVLYFCGYLSSDYYNKILGVKINYEALDIIKWGADFFIYSVIDFFANLRTFGNEWLRRDYICIIVIICLEIFILSLYAIKKGWRTRIFKNLHAYWSCFFCLMILILSIHYLTLFIGKTDLEYKKIMKLGDLNVVYSYFIILNILNVLNVFSANWESVWQKCIKYFLIIPLLFLPALYGVYGRNYDFNCIQKSLLKTSLLLESHGGKNFILERIYNCDSLEIIYKECDNVTFQYKIVNNDDYDLTVEKINFFDFIEDRYKENDD